MSNINNLQSELKNLYNAERAEHSKYFFKTGKGQYAEGDKFYGLTVPQMRILAKKYQDLNLDDCWQLLQDPFHECRIIALVILKQIFIKNSALQKKIHQLYLKAARQNRINNWDLVDISAELLVGSLTPEKDLSLLIKLAKTGNLWERRISIIATFYFIKLGKAIPTLTIAKLLLNDKHDLIHKAVGWMLREVGKKCGEETLTDFLDEYCLQLPRTTLRYAIEKFKETKRKYYLNYGKKSSK